MNREQALRKRIESKAEIYASMRVLRGVHPTEWQCAKQNYQEIASSLAPLVLEMAETLQGILENMSLDWYVQQFSKPIEMNQSGAISEYHNRETYVRMKRHLQIAREALARLDRFAEGK